MRLLVLSSLLCILLLCLSIFSAEGRKHPRLLAKSWKGKFCCSQAPGAGLPVQKGEDVWGQLKQKAFSTLKTKAQTYLPRLDGPAHQILGISSCMLCNQQQGSWMCQALGIRPLYSWFIDTDNC